MGKQREKVVQSMLMVLSCEWWKMKIEGFYSSFSSFDCCVVLCCVCCRKDHKGRRLAQLNSKLKK